MKKNSFDAGVEWAERRNEVYKVMGQYMAAFGGDKIYYTRLATRVMEIEKELREQKKELTMDQFDRGFEAGVKWVAIRDERHRFMLDYMAAFQGERTYWQQVAAAKNKLDKELEALKQQMKDEVVAFDPRLGCDFNQTKE